MAEVICKLTFIDAVSLFLVVALLLAQVICFDIVAENGFAPSLFIAHLEVTDCGLTPFKQASMNMIKIDSIRTIADVRPIILDHENRLRELLDRCGEFDVAVYRKQLDDIHERLHNLENNASSSQMALSDAPHTSVVVGSSSLQAADGSSSLQAADGSSSLQAADGSSSSQAVVVGCGTNHNKSKQPERQTTHYNLYSACDAGCVDCVREILANAGPTFDINKVSDTQGYSALDFAKWGKSRTKNAFARHDDVIDLLRQYGCSG